MITEKSILAAQQKWGQGIVSIGSISGRKELEKFTSDFIDKMYTFKENMGCLFKPTKASKIPFRNTKEGALSYFIGNNKSYPEDTGFALKPWSSVRFENNNTCIYNKCASSMGHYIFTDTNGNSIKVEYSFSYVYTAENNLKINLHHSSIPYQN